MRQFILFDGKVVCKSRSELLSICGSERKDQYFINGFGSPENMAKKLLNVSSDDECVKILNERIEQVRNKAKPSRTTFVCTSNAEHVKCAMGVIKDALVAYINNNNLDVPEDVMQDLITIAESDGSKLKTFVISTYRNQYYIQCKDTMNECT